MPRTARKKSFSGYYHVIIRGTNRKTIFRETKDYDAFLKRTKKYKEEDNVDICAYCLMSNHVHFLIHAELENLTLFMRRIGISYSAYFNKKYECSGHLFQDRFKSEVVEDEKYFLTAYRYILRNPTKAGICDPEEYNWSSLYEINYDRGITDFSFIDQYVEKDDLMKYIGEENDDLVMEYDTCKKDDDWAKEVLKKVLDERGETALNMFDKSDRNEIISQLVKEGLTISQISRVTGISRGVISKVIKK